MDTSSIYTLGYAGHTWDSFVTTLEEAGVTQVADVRDAPISRKAGFGKNQLRQGLADAGIAYRHFVDLGTPKALRDPWKTGGLTQETFYAAYREHLIAIGLEDLAALWSWTQHAPTALLCLESAPEACHRWIVADELAGRYGAVIRHL